MEIILAKHRGFCYGVDRAVNLALKCADSESAAFTLGPIIHNAQVVEYLQTKGIGKVDGLGEIDAGTVIIRSHGVGPAIYEEAESRGLNIVDATCPHVRKVQLSAWDFARDGYQVVVIGEKNHPEVKSILAWAGDGAHVVENAEDAENLTVPDRLAIVSQTTFPPGQFDQIAGILTAKNPDVKIKKTICTATELRQEAAVELAGRVDIIVVAGGKNSANTTRLAQLCRQNGTRVHHIETADELKKEWFSGAEKIGVTAGASTPNWIIEEVILKMQEFDQELKNENEKADKAQEVKAENKTEPSEISPLIHTMDWVEDAFTKMQELQREYENDFATLEKGSVVKGRVVGVRQDEVFVDIGYKAEGIIPLAELAYPQPLNAADVVKEGDFIDVYVIDAESSEGAVKLSKVKADNIVAWDRLQKSMEYKLPVPGVAIEVVKGGLAVAVMGIRGFVPASQVDLRFVEDLNIFVGQELTLVPIEIDREKKRVVLSRRLLLEEERSRQEAELYASISVGQTIKGTVRRLADFGVFVDIGGVDGLIHISDLSWHRVKSPAEIVNMGDEVETVVLKVDPQAKRISLSLKAVQRDPWFDVVDELAEGRTVKGKVTKTSKFGAFVEIAKGVEGLVHLSELDDKRVNSADEVVSAGQDVSVKILSIDKKTKRISLSLAQARQDAERAEYSQYLETDNKGLGVTIGDKLGHLFKRED